MLRFWPPSTLASRLFLPSGEILSQQADLRLRSVSLLAPQPVELHSMLLSEHLVSLVTLLLEPATFLQRSQRQPKIFQPLLLAWSSLLIRNQVQTQPPLRLPKRHLVPPANLQFVSRVPSQGLIQAFQKP